MRYTVTHTTRDHLLPENLPTHERVAEVLEVTPKEVIKVRPFLRHSKGGLKWWKGPDTTERYSADGPLGYGLLVITLLNLDTGKRYWLRLSGHAFGGCSEGDHLQSYSDFPGKARYAKDPEAEKARLQAKWEVTNAAIEAGG
jgi:hypothetical protein